MRLKKNSFCHYFSENFSINLSIVFIFLFTTARIILTLEDSFLGAMSNAYHNNGHFIYIPSNTSFLTYMIQLRDEDLKSSNNLSRLEGECAAYRYGFTYYFQMIYEFLCQDRVTNFCRDATASLLCWLTENFLNQNTSSSDSRALLNLSAYKEVIQEDVSFCTSIACPFVDENASIANFSQALSLYDCMPNWCRGGFFAVLVVDILLAIGIAFANGFVLATGVKNSFFRTPGG